MKILHVYKSEPDDTTGTLVEKVSRGHETAEFRLFEESPDYEALIDLLFECDSSVTWW